MNQKSHRFVAPFQTPPKKSHDQPGVKKTEQNANDRGSQDKSGADSFQYADDPSPFVSQKLWADWSRYVWYNIWERDSTSREVRKRWWRSRGQGKDWRNPMPLRAAYIPDSTRCTDLEPNCWGWSPFMLGAVLIRFCSCAIYIAPFRCNNSSITDNHASA